VPQTEQSTELNEEPTERAELTISRTAGTWSIEAALPRTNASDLLPMVALTAATAVPTTAILIAGTTLPWWTIVLIVLAQLVTAALILWMCRRD